MPLSSSSGTPMSSVELVNAVFDRAWAIAAEKSTTSDKLFKDAVNASGSAPQAAANTMSFSPTAIEPLVNIPSQAEGASVAKFYELSNAVILQLSGLFEGYMTKYFPDDTPYLRSAENWIVKAIEQGGTGIAPAVEAQIWERDRSRVIGESIRAEDEAYSTWAARRYPLPPGQLAHQVAMIRKDAGDKIAQASRDVAIKQAELEVQNVRFAVESAIKLYSAAMSAATDYVKALSVGPASGMQVIPSVTDSQARLISAAADYYRARISVDELRLKAQTVPAEWQQQVNMKNADLVMEDIKAKIQAAIAAAQSMGTQAAATLNALHASAGISGSGSTSVNYSYSNDTVSAVPPITVA